MKRGAEPIIGSASALIGSMIALIIIIVALMPPCDRCQLLYDDDECLDVCDEDELSGDILLHEFPGDISEEDDIKEHELGSINLFLKDDPEVKDLAGSLQVSKNMFSNTYQELTFRIDDVENLKDLILFFVVDDPRGDLMIELNKNMIFSGYKGEGIVEIDLPIDYVEERNTLKIFTSSGFFVSNHYTLKNIKLRKIYERINSEYVEDFWVSSSEKNAIRDSELNFLMYCKELGGQGTFKIYLNGEQIHYEPLVCGGGKRIVNLEKEDFESGRNVIEFVVDNGDFLFNDIVIKNELKEAIHTEFEFEIDDDQYDEIQDEDRDVVLELELDGNRKVATIIINDYTISMDTSSDSFSKDITNYIEEGTNDLEINPSTDFEVEELIIKIED